MSRPAYTYVWWEGSQPYGSVRVPMCRECFEIYLVNHGATTHTPVCREGIECTNDHPETAQPRREAP